MGRGSLPVHSRNTEGTGGTQNDGAHPPEKRSSHQHVEEQVCHQRSEWNATKMGQPERKPVASKHEGSQLGGGEQNERRERRNGNLHAEHDSDGVETKEPRGRQSEENLKA